MNRLVFKLDRSGVRDLMRSSAMMAVCKEHADNIRARCGDGYEVSTHVGKNRVNASVYAATTEARQDNFENNTLEKAVRK